MQKAVKNPMAMQLSGVKLQTPGKQELCWLENLFFAAGLGAANAAQGWTLAVLSWGAEGTCSALSQPDIASGWRCNSTARWLSVPDALGTGFLAKNEPQLPFFYPDCSEVNPNKVQLLLEIVFRWWRCLKRNMMVPYMLLAVMEAFRSQHFSCNCCLSVNPFLCLGEVLGSDGNSGSVVQ